MKMFALTRREHVLTKKRVARGRMWGWNETGLHSRKSLVSRKSSVEPQAAQLPPHTTTLNCHSGQISTRLPHPWLSRFIFESPSIGLVGMLLLCLRVMLALLRWFNESLALITGIKDCYGSPPETSDKSSRVYKDAFKASRQPWPPFSNDHEFPTHAADERRHVRCFGMTSQLMGGTKDW